MIRLLGSAILLLAAAIAGQAQAHDLRPPVALLFFNVGVELGQLAFIAAVLILYEAWRRLWVGGVRPDASRPHTMPLVGAAYCIGGVASFWLVERVYGFWA